MRKQLSILSLLTVMTMVISGCWMHQNSDADRNLPEGEYDRTSTSVNSDGTKVTKKVSSDVDVDDEGNRKAVVKTKTSTDPKGLFNKRTTTTKSVDADEEY